MRKRFSAPAYRRAERTLLLAVPVAMPGRRQPDRSGRPARGQGPSDSCRKEPTQHAGLLYSTSVFGLHCRCHDCACLPAGGRAGYGNRTSE